MPPSRVVILKYPNLFKEELENVTDSCQGIQPTICSSFKSICNIITSLEKRECLNRKWNQKVNLDIHNILNNQTDCFIFSILEYNHSDWPIYTFLTSLLHSIALDPLYPSQCSWETFGYATGGGFNGEAEGLSPLRLSGQLNSLGCSVTFHQGESVSMVKLIEQVRHTGTQTHSVSQRWMSHFWTNLPLGESVPGTTHNLRHPQVLSFPAAVSAKSGHHPGERREFTASQHMDVYSALGLISIMFT